MMFESKFKIFFTHKTGLAYHIFLTLAPLFFILEYFRNYENREVYLFTALILLLANIQEIATFLMIKRQKVGEETITIPGHLFSPAKQLKALYFYLVPFYIIYLSADYFHPFTPFAILMALFSVIMWLAFGYAGGKYEYNSNDKTILIRDLSDCFTLSIVLGVVIYDVLYSQFVNFSSISFLIIVVFGASKLYALLVFWNKNRMSWDALAWSLLLFMLAIAQLFEQPFYLFLGVILTVHLVKFMIVRHIHRFQRGRERFRIIEDKLLKQAVDSKKIPDQDLVRADWVEERSQVLIDFAKHGLMIRIPDYCFRSQWLGEQGGKIPRTAGTLSQTVGGFKQTKDNIIEILPGEDYRISVTRGMYSKDWDGYSNRRLVSGDVLHIAAPTSKNIGEWLEICVKPLGKEYATAGKINLISKMIFAGNNSKKNI